ncbi:uncharacterized protein PFL1_04556 [Pseudozyma flocculosa PF-1]|uniref:ER membrane protein complex subunit 6 n=2 Tax=Pseudozyma flocculosa TaxID=84751 RepID=A0A5C3FC84_9BASI|nr:uncharacterized protein PFL1_04556 [Pseudozyma flocculosa PF-1]EPQ27811.1 hypothetical protein PFL1_04556 [Pseudozyma flocculosa PF-1]SPO41061.1 uncharacterized protein PSFLO_06543 [Pseudozyma flocculosa]
MATEVQEQAEQLRLQSYYPENVAHNAQQFYYIRSTSLSIAGSVAGILGLTNFSGLYLYALSLVVTNILILTINAKSTPQRYFVQPFSSPSSSSSPNAAPGKGAARKAATSEKWGTKQVVSTLFDGAQENGFSFVLWWTFWFAVVHVYD